MKQTTTVLTSCFFTLFTLTLIFTPPAPAAGNDLFSQGAVNFRAGRYQEALTNFKLASRQGLDSGALHYNMGVCYYRLEDLPSAVESFTRAAADGKMAPLAHYNLGLVSLKKGNHVEAISWFDQVVSETEEPKLTKLAELAKAKTELLADAQKSSWFRYASIAYGYDDNVKIVSENDTTDTSGMDDSFMEVSGFFRGPLLPAIGQALQLQLNVYYQNYDTLDEYDYGSLGSGLFYEHIFPDNWSLTTGAEYSYTFLDQERFEQIGTFSLKTEKKAGPARLRFNYFFSYIDVLEPGYDYLAGTRHRFNPEIIWRQSAWTWSAGYTLEINDRDDSEYSPLANLVFLGLRYRPLSMLSTLFRADYRYSVYDKLSGPDREDDYVRLAAGVILNLPARWSINIFYNHYDNDSNDDIYDYRRQTVSAGIAKSF